MRRLLTAAVAAIATATTAPAFARTFVKFLAAATATLIFALTLRPSATHFGLLATTHHAHAAALLWIGGARPVARSQRNFKFIKFVPLGIGPIAIGDGQQFLHALAW